MRDLRVDSYVIESLMPDLVGHDRRPSAYILYLFLWSRTHAVGHKSAHIALVDIAEGTGLAKRTIQQAIAWLEHRKLIAIERTRATDVGSFAVLTPWSRHRKSSPER